MKNAKLTTDAFGTPAWGVDTSFDGAKPIVATPERVRDIVLAHHVVGLNPQGQEWLKPEALKFLPSIQEVETLNALCHEAVLAGRLIDFGDWSQEVIQAGGRRGGPLYHDGVLGHPFREPWMFIHTWEEGSSVYLVHVLDGNPTGGDVVIGELLAIKFQDTAILLLTDRAILLPKQEKGDNRYASAVVPSPFRFVRGYEPVHHAENMMAAAGTHVLDPLMTALVILNTRNIERHTVAFGEKLQRAREKAGKPRLPPYERVNSAPYVTALLAQQHSRERGEGLGGTHRSPVMHLRMGHWRRYADHRTFIMDTLVNATPEARENFKSRRSHYTASQPDH